MYSEVNKVEKNLYEYVLSKEHQKYRYKIDLTFDSKMSPIERMTYRFEQICAAESPVILSGEQICFIRTIENIPDIFTPEEWDKIKQDHFIHELGYMSNLSPDYESVLSKGLLAYREKADEYGKRVIDSIINLSDRYRDEARRIGREDIAQVLEQVPRYPARSFREALQFFRIIHFALWLEGNYHVTVGRFDQYMYPYLQHDLEAGIHTEESALALLEDFFLSFNKDSDLYPGVQQGDNGQSMVLGGIDKNGNYSFNLLSKLCLLASESLKMIDPKINLRVNKNTPLEVYELGTRLTKAGLGFPQYSNDDVVIDGLVGLGYEPEDAADYTVAACWEFIIPKVGADVANIGALSFPKIVDICLHRHLESCSTFNELMEKVWEEINNECDKICGGINNLWFVPSPLMQMCMGEVKYNNFGIHGTGIATAADSLYAIKKHIYDEKTISNAELIEAVDSDFEEHSHILPILRYETEKMGNDTPADDIAAALLNMFASSLEGRKNCRGGIYRAGTGSAMFYLWHANEIGASPDGRRKGEPFGANFSPSLYARIDGPLSVIKSFSKPNLKKTINGGPLTLEFHSSMFTDDECIKKVAMLVKAYMDMGGHQLQLNTVNLDTMKEAQKHPENYRQLVVRIWGWSAYFVEIDKEYQDHVIRRQEYVI
jgi:formate C-acetyltransferase